jgi:hypothetical protein
MVFTIPVNGSRDSVDSNTPTLWQERRLIRFQRLLDPTDHYGRRPADAERGR